MSEPEKCVVCGKMKEKVIHFSSEYPIVCLDCVWKENYLWRIAKSIIKICDDEIEIDGRGDADRYAYVDNRVIPKIIKYLKELKIPVRCPECTTLMTYTESDDLVCPHCGVTE